MPSNDAGIGLILLIIGVAATATYQQIQKQAIGPPLPVMSNLPEFGFTVDNVTCFTRQSLDGNIWVADFIFTRFGGQCPLMTQGLD